MDKYKFNETMAALHMAVDLGVLEEHMPEPKSTAEYHDLLQAKIAAAGWTHEGGGVYHKTTEADQPWVVPDWD